MLLDLLYDPLRRRIGKSVHWRSFSKLRDVLTVCACRQSSRPNEIYKSGKRKSEKGLGQGKPKLKLCFPFPRQEKACRT